MRTISASFSIALGEFISARLIEIICEGFTVDKIKEQWGLLVAQTKQDLFGGRVKEERELQALKNLVHVARERVWLADEPKKREYSTTYSDALDDRERTIITESAKVVEDLLKIETELRRKYVK